jgi:hypothetical protein
MERKEYEWVKENREVLLDFCKLGYEPPNTDVLGARD